jgi:hypothetical protein
MESDIMNNDITAINIELNELKSKFDQAMRGGSEVIDLREIYLQMKELECHINALQWDPEKQLQSHHSSPSLSWW